MNKEGQNSSVYGYIDNPLTVFPSVKAEGIPIAACISTPIQGLERFQNIPRLIQSKVYDEKSINKTSDSILTATNILKKIYQRGFPTRLSPWVETAVLTERLASCQIRLEKNQGYKICVESRSKEIRLNPTKKISIPSEFSRNVNEFFGSIAEKDFYHQVLPVILGDDFWKHTYLQVPLRSVVQNYKTDEFLDFFICMPDGSYYVVEIDGPEHNTPKQRASDQRRDSQLSKHGIKTIRVDLMKHNSVSAQIQFMSKEVFSKKVATKSELNKLHWDATDCLAIQYALVSAISDGAIDLRKDECQVLLISTLSRETVDFCAREVCHSLRELLKIYSSSEETIPNLKITTTSKIGTPHKVDLVLFASASVSSISVDPLIIYNHYGANSVVVTSEFHTFNFKYPAQPDFEDKKNVDTACSDSLKFFLQMIFWKCEFRPLQSEAVIRALSGKDSIVLLPTGSGKSIVYQLTSLLSTGLCVCVAPLVSLVADQVRVLKSSHYITRAFGFYGGATQKTEERERALSLFANGELYFVFLTPERFQQKTFQNLFKMALERFSISQVVIDEAHVVSEWGHDFRPAYLRIGQILSQTFGIKRPTFLALTATAARNVLRDVQRQLKINDPSSVISPSSFDRSNLSFKIIKSPVNGALNSLKYALEEIPKELGYSCDDFWMLHGEETKAGLIFVLTVNGKRSIVDVKNEVLAYLGKMSKSGSTGVEIYSSKAPKALPLKSNQWDLVKSKNANHYIENKVHTLVATSAFGMGIDKPNVRFTINLGLPSSIESFYQQAGRAGRDGQDSLCYLIFEASDNDVAQMMGDDWYNSTVEGLDLSTQSFFLKSSFPGIQAELDELKFLLEYLENNLGKRINIIQRENRTFKKPRHAPTKLENGSFIVQSDSVLYCLATIEKLGIVSNLQVDYSGYGDMNISVAVASEILRESVSEKVYDNEYLYDPGYAEMLSRRVLALEAPLTIRVSYKVWLEAKYETILRGRLRSLRELARIARDRLSESELRKEIENYLTDSIYSAQLDELVSAGAVELDDFVKLGRGASKSEWQELGLQAARLLESSPNSPGLLLLRALSIINEGEQSFSSAYEEISRAIDSKVMISDDLESKVKDDVWSAISLMGTWESIQFIVSEVSMLSNDEKDHYLSKMPAYKGASTKKIGHLMVELDSLNEYLSVAREITTKSSERKIQ